MISHDIGTDSLLYTFGGKWDGLGMINDVNFWIDSPYQNTIAEPRQISYHLFMSVKEHLDYCLDGHGSSEFDDGVIIIGNVETEMPHLKVTELFTFHTLAHSHLVNLNFRHPFLHKYTNLRITWLVLQQMFGAIKDSEHQILLKQKLLKRMMLATNQKTKKTKARLVRKTRTRNQRLTRNRRLTSLRKRSRLIIRQMHPPPLGHLIR